MTVNYIVKEKSSSYLKPVMLFLLYVVLYFILFEFIFPVNFFLPKPTILSDSFLSLQAHYHLGLNLLYTTSIVYLALIFGYVLLSLSAGLILKYYLNDNVFIHSLRVFKYFPMPIFAAIIILWIPNAVLVEILFSLIISYILFVRRLLKRAHFVKPEYIDPLIPMHVKEGIIYKGIMWKTLEPSVMKIWPEMNFLLWTVILVFEYIKGAIGVGFILKMSLEYKDLSGIIVLSIISGIIIFLGNYSIKAIQKLFHWES